MLTWKASSVFILRSGPCVRSRTSRTASPTSRAKPSPGSGSSPCRSAIRRTTSTFYLLGLCWFVLTAAMVAAAVFIHRLEKLGQQAQLEIVNSAVAERQKISADMHDSIGASLAALLAYVTTENVNLADVKRRIGETLMELRFLVDSAEADDDDINLSLSNVRHRMGRSIELTGIDLH